MQFIQKGLNTKCDEKRMIMSRGGSDQNDSRASIEMSS